MERQMRCRATAMAVLVLAAVAACAGPMTPSSPAPSANAPETASPSPATPQPTADAPAGGPPAARLAAEGGDPVVGQLGTYVWRNEGSDSPWLPGAPISVGASEPLTVTFDQAIGVESWRARMVPSAATGPGDATQLGQGGGQPRFGAPAPGSWTVEVHVEFEASLGGASYFWRLEVS
jgi:hypothetical protein